MHRHTRIHNDIQRGITDRRWLTGLTNLLYSLRTPSNSLPLSVMSLLNLSKPPYIHTQPSHALKLNAYTNLLTSLTSESVSTNTFKSIRLSSSLLANAKIPSKMMTFAPYIVFCEKQACWIVVAPKQVAIVQCI